MSHGAANMGAVAAAAAFVFAAAISVAIIVAIRPWLQRIALAKPNARSSHTVPTPQGGGIAVVAATMVAACGALYLSASAASAAAPLLPVFAAVIVIAALGAADDVRPIGVAPRLLLQAFSVALVIFTLPEELRVAPFVPWWIERVLLVVGGLWFVNLVNFMDGLDWMTVAEVVPVTAALAMIGAFGWLPPAEMTVSLALCGAMLGFAYFNRPIARLFLGDVGSLPVGLLLGWLLVQLAGHGGLAAAILLPLYYLADSTITLIRRADQRREGLAGAPLAFLSACDRPRLYRQPSGGARLCGQCRARRARLRYARRARPPQRGGCAPLRRGFGRLAVVGVCARARRRASLASSFRGRARRGARNP